MQKFLIVLLEFISANFDRKVFALTRLHRSLEVRNVPTDVTASSVAKYLSQSFANFWSSFVVVRVVNDLRETRHLSIFASTKDNLRRWPIEYSSRCRCEWAYYRKTRWRFWSNRSNRAYITCCKGFSGIIARIWNFLLLLFSLASQKNILELI